VLPIVELAQYLLAKHSTDCNASAHTQHVVVVVVVVESSLIGELTLSRIVSAHSVLSTTGCSERTFHHIPILPRSSAQG
jgi:hypothetical protein